MSAADPFLREHPVRVEWWGGQFAPGRTDDTHLLDLVTRAHAVATPGARAPEVYGAPYGSDLRLLARARCRRCSTAPATPAPRTPPTRASPSTTSTPAPATLALVYLEHCGVL